MKHYLAIDIGASSGRHIVGWMENGTVRTQEVYRFPNGVAETQGCLTWNIEALLYHVKAGIGAARQQFTEIASLSIDTWGVDYVLMQFDAAIWAHHGLFASGPDFDITFGLMHTIEKAAEIWVLQKSTGLPELQTIQDDELRAMAHDFKVTLRDEFLD